MNDPPVVVDDGIVRVEAGVAQELDPITNDFDVDHSQLTIVGVPTASQGTVEVLSGNILLFTPDAGFLGTDTITYTIADPEGATASGTISVSDSSTNTPPTAGPDLVVDGICLLYTSPSPRDS